MDGDKPVSSSGDSGYKSTSKSLSDGTTIKKEKSYLQQRLLKACELGNLDEVKKIVAGKKVLDLEKCVAQSKTHRDPPLHVAALHGQTDIVRYLVEEEGCKVESRNGYENTPLHRAANGGHLDIVKYLIEERKCNVMCICRWKRTPLHNACKHGRLEVVKYLLPKVDSSAKDSVLQLTPLQLAAEWGTAEVVQCMIDYGVDYKSTDSESKYTLLHLAAYGGKLDIVKYLKERVGYDPMIKDKENKTPLHSACAGGQLHVVKYLVENCKVDMQCHDNRYNQSPLGATVAFKSKQMMSIVKYLVEEKNCIIEHNIKNQNTALHHAAWGGALDAVKYFIEERKCNQSCVGRKGRTPLHLACKYDRADVVDYLLSKHKVNGLVQDHNGATPLHFAAKGGYLLLVKKLVNNYGCYQLVEDNDGRTPMDYKEYKQVTEYLSRVHKIVSGKCYGCNLRYYYIKPLYYNILHR